MSVSSRQQTSQWVLGGIFFFLGLLLLGFHLWLSFFVMAELNQQVQAEDLALQSLKTQQNGFLQPEIRNLFAQYSDGISAVESVFAARDEVFTGEMTEKKFEPVTILDVLDFFKNLQDHLGQETIMEELSLDPSGRLSLLVRTTSYRQAARQIAALRFGFEEAVVVSEDEEPLEPAPHIFRNVSVSNVSRKELVGEKLEELPAILQGKEASYDFIVQAQINPEFYLYRLEQAELVEGEVGK